MHHVFDSQQQGDLTMLLNLHILAPCYGGHGVLYWWIWGCTAAFFPQFLNFVWENQPAHCTSTICWGWGERHGGTLQWCHIPAQGRRSSAPARGLGWARRGRAGVTSCKDHPSWKAGNPIHIHAGISVSCLHSPVSTYTSLKHQCSGGYTKKTWRVKLAPQSVVMHWSHTCHGLHKHMLFCETKSSTFWLPLGLCGSGQVPYPLQKIHHRDCYQEILILLASYTRPAVCLGSLHTPVLFPPHMHLYKGLCYWCLRNPFLGLHSQRMEPAWPPGAGGVPTTPGDPHLRAPSLLPTHRMLHLLHVSSCVQAAQNTACLKEINRVQVISKNRIRCNNLLHKLWLIINPTLLKSQWL